MIQFTSQSSFGLLVLRLFIGPRLIYGVIDNMLSSSRMSEFENFLESNHFPFPFLSAVVSVYAQFICGLLLVAGYYTRWAALVMVVNFLVALVGVHRHDSIEGMTPALSMLVISLTLVFTGPGTIALDGKLRG